MYQHPPNKAICDFNRKIWRKFKLTWLFMLNLYYMSSGHETLMLMEMVMVRYKEVGRKTKGKELILVQDYCRHMPCALQEGIYFNRMWACATQNLQRKGWFPPGSLRIGPFKSFSNIFLLDKREPTMWLWKRHCFAKVRSRCVLCIWQQQNELVPHGSIHILLQENWPLIALTQEKPRIDYTRMGLSSGQTLKSGKNIQKGR